VAKLLEKCIKIYNKKIGLVKSIAKYLLIVYLFAIIFLEGTSKSLPWFILDN
jgi:hypothetical protein